MALRVEIVVSERKYFVVVDLSVGGSEIKCSKKLIIFISKEYLWILRAWKRFLILNM